MPTGPSASARTMSDGEFRLFRELVRARSGLSFDESTRFLLAKRVAARMEKLGLESFAAYHYQLRNDSWREGELAELIDDLTTNETYFFRERRQLRALVDEVLPEALSSRRELGGGPVTVWSAGCSSGEEPYSVAMLAREAGIDPERELRIYASDISKRMLRRARKGQYRESSFRDTENGLRERHFDERDGQWVVRDDVKKCVSFIHLNLMDDQGLALLGAMDVILCRNVIIYFDAQGKRDTIALFERKLRPGGHLLLGHSESLASFSTSLELRHLKTDLVYRKPLPGLGRPTAWNAAAARAIAAVGDEEPE